MPKTPSHFDQFDDDLGGGSLPADGRSRDERAADYRAQKPVFKQPCDKCGGSGRWHGAYKSGPCFTCEGSGTLTFKTPPAERAKAAARRVAKREERDEIRAAWREEHKAEITWLHETATWQRNRTDGKPAWEFPASLLESLAQYGTLTDAQLATVQRFMARNEARQAERAQKRETEATAVDTSALEKAFQIAKARASRPGQMGVWTKPLPLHALGHTISFQPGSEGSQWAGRIFVKLGEKKLGQIKLGRFFRYDECSDAEAAAVVACMGDPAAAAKAYGKAWSRCCVCGQTLTNDVSIENGIGPICAEKYGW
jgi:hypothetical protein